MSLQGKEKGAPARGVPVKRGCKDEVLFEGGALKSDETVEIHRREVLAVSDTLMMPLLQCSEACRASPTRPPRGGPTVPWENEKGHCLTRPSSL